MFQSLLSHAASQLEETVEKKNAVFAVILKKPLKDIINLKQVTDGGSCNFEVFTELTLRYKKYFVN